jgi:hypothetical protein
METGGPRKMAQFADWVDEVKAGKKSPAVFRVYEKLKAGIWSDRGLYYLQTELPPPAHNIANRIQIPTGAGQIRFDYAIRVIGNGGVSF